MSLEQRFSFKRKLMRQVIQRYPNTPEENRVYLTALFHFIDYILHTPEAWQERLEKALTENLKEEGELEMEMFLQQDDMSPTLKGVFRRIKEEGLEQGREEGMAAGIQEATKNVAIELIVDGFGDEKVAKLTKLSLEEIVKLRRSL